MMSTIRRPLERLLDLSSRSRAGCPLNMAGEQRTAHARELAQLAQQEAPFAVTQAFVLALFMWLGWAALRGFRMAKAGD